MYQRFLLNPLREALAFSPAVYLSGPRQSGKSTLTEMVDARSNRYTFDTLSVLNAAQQSPQDFLSNLQFPCVLDEVQRVPELMLPIKEMIDKDNTPGRFLLTGSADLLSRPKISDSLAGRMIIQTLWPLSPQEISGHQNPWMKFLFERDIGDVFSPQNNFNNGDLCRFILWGGYPMVWKLTFDQKSQWFQSYIQTMLERDLREISNYSDKVRIYNLFQHIILRSATVLNALDLSRITQIPMASLGLYLQALESIFLISRIPGWTTNRSKRLTKSHKLFLNDSGLFCYGVNLDETHFRKRPEWGFGVETFVFTEIKKQMSWLTQRLGLYHYRTYQGHEVDFVLENAQGEIVGIEVKASLDLPSRGARGLHHLAQDAGDRFKAGIILYMGDTFLSFGEKMYAVPLAHIL